MHLAILMTNTDESEFAQRHPKDGQKFTDLIQLARPDWTTEVFAVKDGIFPDGIARFDGVMITGSPASVHDDAIWVARLLELIRDMHARQQPLFGACFGHQAIALALRGSVGPNPGGWVHGLTRNSVVERPNWAKDLPDTVCLYGSHVEQVTTLPKDARNLMRSEASASTGFAIGTYIYTTQHHPEMTRDFISALTEEMEPTLGDKIVQAARRSLATPADQSIFAESLARFFEQAHTN